MALIEITVQPNAEVNHFDTIVELDRQRYRFAFFTNTVDKRWYFNVENDNGSAVLNGIALASGIDLLAAYHHLALPPGPLWIHDKGLNGEEPDLDSFIERRCALYYLEVGA